MNDIDWASAMIMGLLAIVAAILFALGGRLW